MPPYFAHSGRDTTHYTDFQYLAAHLRAVAAEARRWAVETRIPDLPELAEAAGWLHDLGKYRPGFQQMLLAAARKEGCPVPRSETYHKEAGAAHAWEKKNAPLALVIEGHHGGLRDGSELAAKCQSGLPVRDAILSIAISENDAIRSLPPPKPAFRDPFQADLFTRVLFGCLIDADWSDTTAHERGVRGLPPEPDSPPLDPAGRLGRVCGFIAAKAEKLAGTPIGQARQDVLDACLARADDPPGMFSLTVPTGGGKTLASLAFALKHAAENDLRRVIYVAPYMTILEQNADVIREALGVGDADPTVFAHYSLAEPLGDEGPEETGLMSAARRAESWDAPVVVTTNVQFFESLFSNKPGRCRKLHNIARSVIILDECQTLPPGLVAPTCGMLKQLAGPTADGGLGCSVVLCTATQPAFNHPLLKADERLDAREIIPQGVDLFGKLKRVHVTWPRAGTPRLTWADVAAEMRKEPAALCVVNTKKAARAVYEELKKPERPGVFHLSTGMCPQHRREKLSQIRSLLQDKAPCYVVSTQLIEAGVDVDFPFLMREMGPLESVIQAAGRCNREGRIPDAGGRVLVFWSEEGKMPPERWYNAGRDTLKAIIAANNDGPQIDDATAISDYFQRLYYQGGAHALDDKRIRELQRTYKFKSVGEEYKLIPDAGEAVVVRTWGSRQAEIDSILVELAIRPRKELYRALAKFQVNLLPSQRLKVAHLLHEDPSGVLVWDGKYDEDAGIVEEMADAFII